MRARQWLAVLILSSVRLMAFGAIEPAIPLPSWERELIVLFDPWTILNWEKGDTQPPAWSLPDIIGFLD